MAACPKCCNPTTKPPNGQRSCRRCGPIGVKPWQQPLTVQQIIASFTRKHPHGTQ